jgi:octaheme c-type cytochrome (tetrathionate reductase family)
LKVTIYIFACISLDGKSNDVADLPTCCKPNLMKNLITFFLSAIVPILIITLVLRESTKENRTLQELRAQYPKVHSPGVDHSKHEILQQAFSNPHQITATCLSCHTERGKELLESFHFTWEREEYIPGKGITYLGKKNMINNFCTGIASNEASCNRCHAGYGWLDNSFDFSNQYNIDCLVCHDQTGLYQKARGAGGYPVTNADQDYFRKIVQSVGLPTKQNCGYCHFYGGGGNNVKHGDLEEALLTASREVDVHMGTDGGNMQCIDCHGTANHKIIGKYFAVSSENKNRVTCEQCHSSTPHTDHKLNEHVVKIACQTCHIPVYAKVNATKISWDWSTAANRLVGRESEEVFDSIGNPVYLPIKGDFNWKTNAVPEYFWFNGTAGHHLATDIIEDESQPLKINTLFGSFQDKDSRIIPVKVHRGKQPYDTEYKGLLQAKLWDAQPGEGALWLDLNWEAALEKGMKNLGRPYSGNFDFINTELYLPVNHMVSPASKALSCNDCHTRIDSRMASIPGAYIPAATVMTALDNYGILMILFSFAAVGLHAAFRIRVFYKNKKNTAS